MNAKPRLTVNILTRASQDRLARLIGEVSSFADEILIGVDAEFDRRDLRSRLRSRRRGLPIPAAGHALAGAHARIRLRYRGLDPFARRRRRSRRQVRGDSAGAAVRRLHHPRVVRAQMDREPRSARIPARCAVACGFSIATVPQRAQPGVEAALHPQPVLCAGHRARGGAYQHSALRSWSTTPTRRVRGNSKCIAAASGAERNGVIIRRRPTQRGDRHRRRNPSLRCVRARGSFTPRSASSRRSACRPGRRSSRARHSGDRPSARAACRRGHGDEYRRACLVAPQRHQQ